VNPVRSVHPEKKVPKETPDFQENEVLRVFKESQAEEVQPDLLVTWVHQVLQALSVLQVPSVIQVRKVSQV
jgi:hypothetical protein